MRDPLGNVYPIIDGDGDDDGDDEDEEEEKEEAPRADCTLPLRLGNVQLLSH